MKGQITPEQATIRLETLCARAEHSTGEAAEKLRKWGIPKVDSDRIIAHLHKAKFIDDSRFARAYVKDKVKFSRWGRRKIEQGLYAKRIDRSTIAEAIAEIDPEEYSQNLRDLYKAKIKNTPSLLESYEGRTKLFRFALSRGFESQIAAEILRETLRGIIS